VLRSGAGSPAVRCLGYAAAVACGFLFAYLFVIAILVAFYVDHVGLTLWVGGLAVGALAFVMTTVAYVSRKPYPGGYVLAALASLAAGFVCFVAFLPFLVW
jgi:hypothetical protein